MPATRLQTLILQDGELPLSPEGRFNRRREHRCTTTLVWPVGVKPTSANSVIVDPCFTARGWETAVSRLAALGVSSADIGYYFVTHEHFDHTLLVPPEAGPVRWQPWRPGIGVGPADLFVVRCVGHAADLQAVKLDTAAGEVWIVGDAILSLEWLQEWSYYWPNGYDAGEVIETWRSVAAILAHAKVVIPGHGPVIAVTATLLGDLTESFPEAPYAASCLDVMRTLKARWAELTRLPA